ncbi:MAG: metal-sulfur cluster assembly factor [Candidatus Micrarchaeota archaeon]
MALIAKAQILEKLKEVIDPELNINIVDLGLVYDVWVESEKIVHIKVTMTTPMCPMLGEILEEIKQKLSIFKFEEIDTVVVWDPPWTPEKMSEEAKAMVGIF